MMPDRCHLESALPDNQRKVKGWSEIRRGAEHLSPTALPQIGHLVMAGFYENSQPSIARITSWKSRNPG